MDMESLTLCKYLISTNVELVNSTALGDCHCIGLRSFIINEKPKIRLFIAEPDCELYQNFNPTDPIIAIHPHRYDDIFIQLEGRLTHHIYQLDGNMEFNKYGYLRLSDCDKRLHQIGTERLDYIGAMDDVKFLKSDTLHTASISGNRCSWMIIETFENADFNQFAYHKDLVERPELYKKIPDGVEYLNNYFINNLST